MRFTACFALSLVACGRGPVAPEASTVSITLDGAWTNKPWLADPPGPPTGFPTRLSTTLVVPAALAGQPAELVLEGLWWSAVVFVDGQRVGTVVGGRAPARLELPSGLSAGSHTLGLSIAAPRGVSKFAHGGGLGSATSTVRGTLHRPPRLEFGAPVATRSAGIRVAPGGATAFVSFEPSAVPEGSTVHLFTALDGHVQTDFGTATVQADGAARSVARAVDQPLWSWGDPELTHLMAELTDPSGQPVGTFSTRTGLRSTALAADGLRINDTSGPAVAIRVTHGLAEPSFLETFSAAVPGGVNAVEIHGAMADGQLMDFADELGVPIIHLPRCVGRVGRPPGNGEALVETLREQDEALVRAVGAHPSVVSWLVEGDRQVLGPGRNESGDLPPWTAAIPGDPMRRPVAGVDLPGTLLRITDLRAGAINCPAGCDGKWIVESTFRIVPAPNLWALVAGAWSKAFATGIPGGTLPTPSEVEQQAWAAAFAPVLAEAGVEPFPLDRKRRARSRVAVTGASPGSLVWVTAPGMTPRGSQVDASGAAVVDVWYAGTATIHGDGWTHSAELAPMQWQGTKLFGYSTAVSPPAGPPPGTP